MITNLWAQLERDQTANCAINHGDSWVCTAWFQWLIKCHKNHRRDVASCSLNRRDYCCLIWHKLYGRQLPILPLRFQIVQFLLSSSPGKCHQHYSVTTAYLPAHSGAPLCPPQHSLGHKNSTYVQVFRGENLRNKDKFTLFSTSLQLNLLLSSPVLDRSHHRSWLCHFDTPACHLAASLPHGTAIIPLDITF